MDSIRPDVTGICPRCGYTRSDHEFHGDHRLCKNHEAMMTLWYPQSTPSPTNAPQPTPGPLAMRLAENFKRDEHGNYTISIDLYNRILAELQERGL